MIKKPLNLKKRNNLLLFIVFTFFVTFWFFLTPINALALSFNSSTVSVTSLSNENLLEEIDGFFSSMPKTYYTIMKVDELKNLSNILLIDVREPSEYAGGHIPKAINIPLRNLPQNLAQIPKIKPVVLYCSSGYRSAMGVMTLRLLGYTNVRGFPPSIGGWKTAGEPLEVGNIS